MPSVDDFASRLAAVTATDPWLVAAEGDRVRGYAYATPFRARPAYGRTRETTVYVHPDAHGEGVGSALLATLLDRLRSSGAHRAIAGIVPPNPGSVALHQRLGFTAIGTFSEVGHKFDRWHDVEFWECELNPAARP